MRRREFITLIGGAAAWPLAARAQPGPSRLIAMLISPPADDPDTQEELAAFKQGLSQLGWIEGRNVRFESRFGASDSVRRPVFAKELVALRPDLLFSYATPQTAALQRETSSIPIVFLNVSDPVGSGFAKSFAHPGGNITGFTNFESTMSQKWLELLTEVAPNVKRVGVLFNPETAVQGGKFFLQPMQAAAHARGVELIVKPIHSPDDLERATAELATIANSGFLIIPDSYLSSRRSLVASLALRHRLPAVYSSSPYARVGGLITLAIDRVDQCRRVASYVDRIFKGEKPGELPIQAPTKFELIINLRTAKEMGIDVPWFLQQRADEVIE